ncbi:FAD synthetase family protein [Pseudogemmobacter humi]|uniref:FAD synthase n=1 Tax=Pseudogemmobacter humi TaxID=2483812 RepID=A0A3P5XEQ8_9RHOB|nr:FAD synthetase family protein [Pseudogemmobacter humi]VDC29356.1 Putative riboflavin biosynthesis protein RibF [Pseudogemmobacter humi]
MLEFGGAVTEVSLGAPAPMAGSVLAIGAFDGVHLGHQRLIQAAVADGWRLGLQSVIWTFDPPPKVVFGRAAPLCGLEEKLTRIARLGPDLIVVIPFGPSYAARTAAQFIADLTRISPRHIHVGADFRFGARQSGDVALLAEHFPVTLAAPVCCAAGETISSTRLRDLRTRGECGSALMGPEAALICAPSGAHMTLNLHHREAMDGWN